MACTSSLIVRSVFQIKSAISKDCISVRTDLFVELVLLIMFM